MINPHAFFNVIDCQGTRGTSLRNAATARGSTRGGLTAEHLLACFSAMHRKQEGMPASTSGKVFSLWPMSLLECERLVHLLDVDGQLILHDNYIFWSILMFVLTILFF
jgi:hypothetical protein